MWLSFAGLSQTPGAIVPDNYRGGVNLIRVPST